MHRTHSIGILIAFVLASCGVPSGRQDTPPGDEGLAQPDDLPGISDSYADTADVRPSDVEPPDPGIADLPDADVAADPCPGGMIFIDFPCDRSWRCIDSGTYIPMQTVTCEDEGFDPMCCSGAGCRELEPVACPPGTLCVDGAGRTPCAPLDCGGDFGAECGKPDDLCELPTGACDAASAAGVCVGRTDCTWYWDYPGWVCGCDGTSYLGDCVRRRAGVAKHSEGTCCLPEKIAFPRENPDGYTSWVACLSYWDQGWNESEVRRLDYRAECFQRGDASGCNPGEIGCRGPIDLEEGGRQVADAAWEVLCRIAGLPFVTKILGVGGPSCDGVPCAEVPYCDEVCSAPCGCCQCASGTRRCSDPIAWDYCIGGCWKWTNTPACKPGSQCIEYAPGHTRCERTCEATAWTWNDYTHDYCEVDAECTLLRGFCEIGLGACWEAVRGAVVDQAFLDDLAVRWLELGCPAASEPCDCPARPSGVQCLRGTCTLVP